MGLSWKAIVSKIHPPLSMTPRESQRLLTLLNTSFKQQLDRHHPTTIESYTALHLRSILTNPLFDSRPSNGGVSLSTDYGKGIKSLGLVQDLVNQPMDIFKEQVAAGTATMQSALLCLQAEYKNCLASPAATMVDAMRTSGTGSIILGWLWSSGTESSGSFLANRPFIKLLVPFLVAEKQHDRIWHWLHFLGSELSSASSSPLRNSLEKSHCYTLMELIKSEVTVGGGLDAAIATFVRLVGGSGPRVEKRTATHGHAVWYLTKMLKGNPKAADLRDGVIRSFMEAAGTLRKPTTLLSACHWVHLAKRPDPNVALLYFRNRLSYDGIQSRKRLQTVLLGLKSAEVFLERGCQAEALWVMDHLQTNFSKEIGLSATTDLNQSLQRTSEDAEESSLRLLDALAIQ